MMSLKDAERKFRLAYILHAVEIAGANVSTAAEMLGTHRNTLWRDLKAAGYTSRHLVRISGRKRLQNRLNPRPGKKPPVRETDAAIDSMMELAAHPERVEVAR